jgi:hypothetical protein
MLSNSTARIVQTTICLVACIGIATAQQPVELQCKQLTESSGLAVSTRDPQIIWTHNDSGDKPRLFAFKRNGAWIAEVELKNAKATDWEDMCSFRRNGKHYLAVGDVGDNQRNRSSVSIYVVEEPELDVNAPTTIKTSIRDVERIQVQYATGPADCESLAYDPVTDKFLLATKELIRCQLTTFDTKPTLDGKPLQLSFSQVLGLPLTTAADISSDGQWLVIATYGPACIFKRTADGKWDANEDSIQTRMLPARRQGESICFADDDQSLLVTSEFAPTPLWSIAVEPTKKE